ncbi:MAG: DUF6541 family protein [Candidatus Bathyarchaeia archaeon]|jgi:hypothetical protein
MGHLITNLFAQRSLVKLDFIQKLNLKIIMGMAFASIFLELFSLGGITIRFSSYVLLTVTIIGVFLLLVREEKNGALKIGILHERRELLVFLTIFVILVAAWLLSSSLISGYYGSTADDGAFHTFMLRVTLANPHALLGGTTAPYAAFQQTYGMGFYSIGAFIATILGIPIYQIVPLFMSLFPGLIALSFYSSAKSLFKNSIVALIASFCSVFLVSGTVIWQVLGWSGVPFIFSIYICISSLGVVLLPFESQSARFSSLFLLALFVYFSIEVYSVSMLFIFFWFLIIVSFTLIRKTYYAKANFVENIKSFFSYISRRKIGSFLIALVPLLFVLPYFNSLYHIIFSSNNGGYASDIPSGAILVDIPNLLTDTAIRHLILSNFLPNLLVTQFGTVLIFTFISIIAVPVLALFCLKSKRVKTMLPNFLLKPALLIMSLMGLLFFYLLFLSNKRIIFIGYDLFPSQRVFSFILIPSILLAAVSIYLLFFSIDLLLKCVSMKANRSLRASHRKLYAILILLLLFGNIFVVGFREFEGQINVVKADLKTYDVLGPNDITLMLWMKTNTPMDSIVLVSSGDSGQYVTSIAQRKTIYPYSLDSFSAKYENLLTALKERPAGISLLDSLLYYNISYVYIGSEDLTYGQNDSSRFTFNPQNLLEAPYFSLEKQVGNAELIKFNSTLADEMLDTAESLTKVYFFDSKYPTSGVQNLTGIVTFLQSNEFAGLDADKLNEWMTNSIENNSASESVLVLPTGTVPDTILTSQDSTSLVRSFLNAGGRVVWIGDAPFLYEGHSDGPFTTLPEQVSINILGVQSDFSNSYNASSTSVTNEGVAWGISSNYSALYPISSSEVSYVLANVVNSSMASSWVKVFPAADGKNSGDFIRLGSAEFSGSDNNMLDDLLNAALHIAPYKNWTA